MKSSTRLMMFGIAFATMQVGNAASAELPADYCLGLSEPPHHLGSEISGTRGWDVWNEFGIFGEGVRVGISSTGASIQHEALTQSYAGTLPDGSFDHNYAWYDFFESTTAPVDTRVEGTFLAGVVAGVNQDLCFGVAPQAKFMSCRVFDPLGRETPQSQLRCLQFFLAPHDLNEENPRPELRPDVVLSSWCEGCTEGDELLQAIQALRAAGTVIVAPTGPSFPGTPPCGKVVRPPTNYPHLITVNALGADNRTLDSSAAGPAWFDDSVIQKPDLATTGEHVIGSVWAEEESQYFTASGSKLAAAVATGVVGLVISSNPQLKGQPRLVEEILYSTAKTRVDSQCDADKDLAPNREFGFGALDAYQAVKRAMAYPYGGCPAQPVESCHMDGAHASFSVSQTLSEAPDEQQRIDFRYHAGEALAGQFGEPDDIGGETFRLCVYDTVDDVAVPSGRILNSGFALGTAGDVAAGRWSSSGVPGALRYRFDAPSVEGNDGIVSVQLNEELGTIHFTGAGLAMPLSRVRSRSNDLSRQMYEAESGVIVQAHSTASGACWGAHFDDDDTEENNNHGFDAFIGCAPEPWDDCRSSERSVLMIGATRDGSATKRLRWSWQWGDGELEEFGAPEAGTAYGLCIYEDGDLLASLSIPPGDDWRGGRRAIYYRDPQGLPDGIRTVVLGASAPGRARIAAVGVGDHLPHMPLPLPDDAEVEVQMVGSDVSECWGSTFTSDDIQRNTPMRLQARFR